MDVVLAQGGSDDVGITQAFVQYGDPYKGKMPVIESGGGTDFVKWWADGNAMTGYKTISMNTTSGRGADLVEPQGASGRGARWQVTSLAVTPQGRGSDSGRQQI